MKKNLFLLVVLTALFSCKSTEKKCRFGDPTPIFSEKLDHVKLHQFEKKDGESLESVIFDTGITLEVEQTGCEHIKQEFRFMAPGDRQQLADSLWIKESVRQLVFLSSLGPKQAPLRTWADAIEAVRKDMKLGENFDLGGGVTAQVGKIVGPEQSVLTLVLSQKVE